MWLFWIFLAVPIIEIALFIQVGGAIGMPLTLAIVILTALAGTYLVRSQGADAMRRIQFSLQGMEDPTTPTPAIRPAPKHARYRVGSDAG